MKILIIGAQESYSLENVYIHELSKEHDVEFHNIKSDFLNYYNKNIINKLRIRLGSNKIYEKINTNLLAFCTNKYFDLIWVFKGMELFPSTIKKLKNYCSLLINYNGDHPFVHQSRGSGNKYVINAFKYYDFHLSYSKYIINSIKEYSNLPSYWLPFAYVFSREPQDFELNIACFVGSLDSERKRMIRLLAKNNVTVHVYGDGWTKTKLKNIKLFPAVYKNQYIDTIQKYRLHLNIFRPHNYDSHNMRTFEVTALGAIMLAPKSSEHLSFFEQKKEAFYYCNDDEFVAYAKKILKLSKSAALQVKKAAYLRSLNSEYSYQHRSQSVIKLVKSHLNSKQNDTRVD